MVVKRTELKSFRARQNMTQEQIAKEIGCSRNQYALIEQGNKNGSQEFWSNLQKRFDIADSDMWNLMQLNE